MRVHRQRCKPDRGVCARILTILMIDDRLVRHVTDTIVRRFNPQRLVLFGSICFHAQQGAEKMLEAFLVAHHSRPPKWHDLGSLLQECIKLDSSLALLESQCDLLTFGVLARYPGTGVDPDLVTTREMVTAAEHVRSEIRRRLGASQP